MKHLVLFAIAVIAAFLVSLLGVYVTLSIASLYSLSFITQFSFIQLYGIFCVSGILRYKYEKSKSKKEQSTTEMWLESFTVVLSPALYYIIAWGISFAAFSILS